MQIKSRFVLKIIFVLLHIPFAQTASCLKRSVSLGVWVPAFLTITVWETVAYIPQQPDTHGHETLVADFRKADLFGIAAVMYAILFLC